MAIPVDVAVKRGIEFRASWSPTSATHYDTLYMSWVEPPTGAIRVVATSDLRAFGDPVDLGVRSRSATALTADRSGLVLAWVDADSGEVSLARSEDGSAWRRPIRTGLRSAGNPRIAAFDGRLWLALPDARRGGFDVFSSDEGREWQLEHSVTSGSVLPPTLVVLDGRLSVTWVDGHTGELRGAPIGAADPAASTVVYDGPLTEPTLLTLGETLYLAWSDADTAQIHVLARTTHGWRERSVIHERTDGPPALVALSDDVGVAWIRADGTSTIHVQRPADDTVIEPIHVFHGDLQGHPTALSSDHHTPYPYLGIVVLPNDWALPKGKTETGLTSALDSALDAVADFWKEASFGAVDITHDVHPSVVTLPSPMSTYLVRARPKLIDGYGASYPIGFTGSKTLELAAAGSFTVTITFPDTSLTLDGVISAINVAIKAGNYAGPAASKPVAAKSDVGQLRIQTAGQVDPGDPLAVTGGTALGLLGLDAANRVLYEGNTKQTEHLDLMLRDALKAVAQGQQNPAAYLRKYYGYAITIASNLGWYALRECASVGPDDVAVLPGEKDFTIASYYVTSLTSADTHAHEVGHNLGFPDEYEEGARNVGAEPGAWSGMDSNLFSHPTAWEKAYRSAPSTPAARWVDAAHVATLDSTKQSVEVLLAPLEAAFPATNPFAQSHPGVPLCHAVKVGIGDGHAYYVENRQRGPWDHPQFGHVEYSQHLPGDGIIVTDAVDDLATLSILRVPVVMVHPIGLRVSDVPETAVDQVMAATTVAAKHAIIDAYVPTEIPQWVADKVAEANTRDEIEWILRSYRDNQIRGFYPVDTLNEDVLVHQFPDGDGEIRLKLLEVIGTTRPFVYKVRVSWGRKGSWFDFEIRKWQSPPPYDTEDIWIDSAENGWDTYEHSDAATNPGVKGNPILNGDPPWVGHDNRVMARVWNRGDIAQNNVRVDFYEVIPPGQSNGYPFDTDFIDIPAGGSAIATGIWRPLKVPADEHGCVAAQVEYRAWDVEAKVIGELNANNNAAQENITDFYVTKSSPYTRVELPFEFASPLPTTCEMKLTVSGLEPGWTLTVEPYRFELQPGESMQGVLALEAADTVPLEDPREGRTAPTVSLEALVRIGCSWERVGGFSMIAHTVRLSTLDVAVDPSGDGAHVAVRALDSAGPITGANVAIALVLDGNRTLSLTRVTTDGEGRAHTFISIDWNRFGAGAALTVDARLSPKGKSGPCSVTVPVPHS